MGGYVYSCKRKVHQRAINKAIRKLNKSLFDDEMWRSRFFVRQVEEQHLCSKDTDGSKYMTVAFTLRFYDKKSMKYIDYIGTTNNWLLFNGYKLKYIANKVITEDFPVWTKLNDPRDDTFNYRLIPESSVVASATAQYDYVRSV